jgi:hypothetical protein
MSDPLYVIDLGCACGSSGAEFGLSTEYALSGRRSARRAPPDLTQSTTLDNSSRPVRTG